MDPKPAVSQASEEGQRLAKIVAARLTGSRREAEPYIVQGWVRVDGQRIDPKAQLGPPLPP
jgi:23S rRNA pseudouridine2604 synthase